MQTVSKDTFGPLVAYLIPGVTILAGLSYHSVRLRLWFGAYEPTIGGFLYLTLAAIAAGMTVSAIRWAVVDTLHAKTGLKLPPLDFARLGENVNAFTLLIEIHYRHYQFYANMLVATAIAYVSYRIAVGVFRGPWWIDCGFVVLEGVFFATSRDTLGKYYARSRQVLGDAGTASRSDSLESRPMQASSTPVPADSRIPEE